MGGKGGKHIFQGFLALWFRTAGDDISLIGITATTASSPAPSAAVYSAHVLIHVYIVSIQQLITLRQFAPSSADDETRDKHLLCTHSNYIYILYYGIYRPLNDNSLLFVFYIPPSDGISIINRVKLSQSVPTPYSMSCDANCKRFHQTSYCLATDAMCSAKLRSAHWRCKSELQSNIYTIYVYIYFHFMWMHSGVIVFLED